MRTVPTIQKLEVRDIRFPTSRLLDGSDAMNPDPDYSAAYVILHTDSAQAGHGLTFTIGRGQEVVIAAVKALEPLLIGRDVGEFTADMGAFYRHITGDSQLRWIGPEKGAMHLATAAAINAVWDLWAKLEGKPLWKLLVDLSPTELVRCIDFRYISDALTPDEALELLEKLASTKPAREVQMLQRGHPAYTTSAGWLGYSDAKIRQLCRQAVLEGWTHLKVKVGRDLDDDLRRLSAIREEIGWERHLMLDANQVWDVEQAIEWVKKLAHFKPLWIEEPTNPDDILGHARIAAELRPLGIGVATGEHGQNRVLFKQLLQANAIAFCQIDACRVGGVIENLAIMLMAAKFGVPVCPHAGGVGLCEQVAHLSIFNYIAVAGHLNNTVTEYVDHLHEHFLEPTRIVNAHYQAPVAPGYSTAMHASSLDAYEFPHGSAWKAG